MLINFLKSYIKQFLLDKNIYISKLDSSIFYNSFISLTLAKHKVLFKERNKLENDFLKFCIENYNESYSQRGQDLFALYVHSKSKNRNKICIEFGAGDGKFISNTFLLSKKNFKSLLIEPTKRQFSSLKNNRKEDICIRGIIKGLNEEFDRTLINDAFHYTKRADFIQNDETKILFKRNFISSYKVKAFDLNNLLNDNFPDIKNFNYLSIDTEGGELQIIKSINFEKYIFDCITIECTIDDKDRPEIISYLKSKKYTAIFSDDIAFTGVDVWFVHDSINI